MRIGAACLALLLLLSFLSVAGIGDASAYEIIYRGIFKDVHEATFLCANDLPCECGTYPVCESDPTHTFTTNDKKVYLVFVLTLHKGEFPLHSLRSEWRDPTGSIISRSSKGLWDVSVTSKNPVLQPGNYKFYDQIEVKEAKPPQMSGLYSVTALDGDRELFTEYFGINHYPVFLNVTGLPQGEYVSYSVDGVESGRLEAGNVSVTSFLISESHTVSTPSTLLASNGEQFECNDCSQSVSKESTLSFHYTHAAYTTTTVATSATSQLISAVTSTSTAPATVTVTVKESGTDFGLLSMAISLVAIAVVAILGVIVLRRKKKESQD